MVRIDPPRKRHCEHCGRAEVWDSDQETWVAADSRNRGTPHCVHAWNVTGSYNPLTEEC